MRKIFVDTLYWLAIIIPNDSWQAAANKARSLLGNVIMVTSDEVLSEFLNHLSRGGEHMRRQAAKMVRSILDNPNIKVIPQSRDSFLRGLELYGQRLDKSYSMTDCISMNIMKKELINEVLTNDRHFEQEGHVVLISK
jgi:predicted nucleic acid-binding protein